jgi:hypothetical protein
MISVGRAYDERPDANLLAGVDLDYPFEVTSAEQPASAAWDDDRRRLPQLLERGNVQVIVVEMGDEYPVEIVEHPSICRCCAPHSGLRDT